MSLRWITDEGADIDPAEEPVKAPRPGHRRWWLFLLFITAITFSFFYVRQMRQAQAQEALLAADVAASYQVWQEAVLTGDEELFTTLLATWDPDWQKAQRQLFNSGRIWDRSNFGMDTTTPLTSTIKNIEITPDWQAAWVETGRLYEASGTNGQEIDVHLTQYQRYERSGFRWLATAPDAAFWGEREEIKSRKITISVPGRDTDLAWRMLRDLDRDLEALCREMQESGSTCPAGTQLQIFFDHNPHSLLAVQDLETPVFQGETYRLPTPTLVGFPEDDAAYAILYRGYMTRLLETYQHNLASPIPLPDQQIAALCFPAGGHTMKLFTVNPVDSTWKINLPERNFLYLSPAPDGGSVILQEYGRGLEPNHLRLLQWQGGTGTVLYDNTNSYQVPRLVGWAGPVGDARLLIHSIVLNRADIFYNWLDLDHCTASGCSLSTLPGYTVWSPAGEHTLVTRRGEIWLGDSEGNMLSILESGFNPFWLDESTYGYSRYTYPDGGRPVVEIVTGSISSTGEVALKVVLRSSDLTAVVDSGQVFIDFVTPLPGRPNELLVSGPGLGSGRYYGFQVSLADREAVTVKQIVNLPDTIRGHPGLITPTGYAPFGFSPDGRWLIASSFVHPGGKETVIL